MTATAHATLDATAASSGRLSSVASGVLEFVWPMYLTLVFTLGAWVLVPTVLLGWQPMTIISGSMAPTVQPGHVVVVEPYDDQDLKPGKVVTYRDAGQDRLVTHRIASVDDDGTITTRGDANAVDDQTPLTTDRIVGVGRLVVPAAGLPSLWAYQGRTDLLAIVVVLTVLAAGSAARAAAEATRSVRQRLSLRGGVRPTPRRTVALAAGVVAVLGLLGGTAVSRAAFVGAGDNAANTFQAGTVTAPSGLAATAKCQLLNLVNLVPRVELTWQPATGSTVTYQLYRSTAASGPYALLQDSVSGTAFTDHSVTLGNTYHYRARTKAGTWTSDDSATASATVSEKLLSC